MTELARGRELSLEYVFGRIRVPGGGGDVFIGWNTEGYPALVRGARKITEYGRRMIADRDALAFPLDSSVAEYTPVALEFAQVGAAKDNQDRGLEFTEDVVNIACTDGQGRVKWVSVKELTLLDSILNGQITWQIGGENFYSVIIPVEENQTLNFILFSPGQESSNELAYRTFLLQVIKSLTELDGKQNPPDQKGYKDVIRAVVAKLEDRVRQRDANQGGIKAIAMRLGVLEEIRGVGAQELKYLPLEDLREILRVSQTTVEESFRQGK